MSSILASLDMSLDDLIAKKKTKPTNPDARQKKAPKGKASGAAGPVRGGASGRRSGRARNQPYSRSRGDDDMDMDMDDDAPPSSGARSARRSVSVKKQQPKGGKKGASSILSRLGSKDAASLGTKILVKNLKFDILEDEVRELFGTVGEVAKAEIVYDRSGRSKGIARVWFVRRSDADKAIKQYDGRTLDGQPMQITLDNDKNVRKGLFGTALASRDDKDVKFKVSFGANQDSRDNRGSRDNRDNRDSDKGRGAGRRRRGGGRGRDERDSAPAKTAADLDNEMDTYMKDS